jgi:carboxyl-terminal processing protease
MRRPRHRRVRYRIHPNRTGVETLVSHGVGVHPLSAGYIPPAASPIMRIALQSLQAAVIGLALATGAPASAQEAITGNWQLWLEGPQTIPVVIALAESGGGLQAAVLTGEGTLRFTRVARTPAGFDATVASGPAEYAVRATIRGDSLAGEWSGSGFAGTMRGTRLAAEALAPIAGAAVFDSVARVLERRFYDPGMNGADWPALLARLRPRAAAATNDVEAYGVISELLAGIGGSHLGFSAAPRGAPSPAGAPARAGTPAPSGVVRWRVLSPSLGYLRIDDFSPTGAAARPEFARLDSAFAALGNLPALIIDLRSNPGGSLDLAAWLARHLIARPTPGGYFVTQTGYTSRGMRTAQALDAATVPPLDASIGGGGLYGAVQAAGGAAMVYVGGGAASPYAGRVAILTDRRTGSAAEAVAAALREARGAITVGDRTAGAMLSSDQVGIAPGWRLRYPMMDYRTAAGVRVEGDGVRIDVPAPVAGDAPIRAAAQALGQPLPE